MPGERIVYDAELRLRGPRKVMAPLLALMVPRRNKVLVENLGKVLAD